MFSFHKQEVGTGNSLDAVDVALSVEGAMKRGLEGFGMDEENLRVETVTRPFVATLVNVLAPGFEKSPVE